MIPVSINPGSIIQGPAILYSAPFGTAEPADSSVTPAGYTVVPAAPWADAGSTQEGVMFDVDTTITEQTVDQVPDPVGGRLTKRVIQVTTTLAETTLANLNLAMNGLLTISVNSGYTTADVQTTTSATQPSYASLMIYGWGPLLASGSPSLRRLIIRKCLSQVKVSLAYQMAKNAVYAVTFSGYYISPSISPFHISEATA